MGGNFQILFFQGRLLFITTRLPRGCESPQIDLIPTIRTPLEKSRLGDRGDFDLLAGKDQIYILDLRIGFQHEIQETMIDA